MASTQAQMTTQPTEEENTDCYTKDEVTKYFFGFILFLLIIGLIIYVIMYSSKSASTPAAAANATPTSATSAVATGAPGSMKYLLSNTPNM
jgi:hypothetical protein